MKHLVFIFIILLQGLTGFCRQSDTGHVHPLFTGERLNGDKVREQFDNFEPAFLTGKPKGPHNDVVLSMFHSRKLYLNSSLRPTEKLPELAPFRLELKPGGQYAIMGGGGVPRSRAVPLFDSLPVVVTAYGINPGNREQFRYRVLQNESEEIVPWKVPALFSPVMMHFRYNADGTEQTQMAYLGVFHAPVGSSLTVEVRDLLAPDTVYKISAVWVRRSPEVIGTFSAENLKDLISVFKYQWKNDPAKPNRENYYGNLPLKPVDSLLKRDRVFSHDQNTLFFYTKDKVQSAEFVEYRLVRGKDSSRWQANSFDPNVILLQKLRPGDYTLLLRYSFQRETVNSYKFSIASVWYQATWFKLLAGFVMLTALLSVYLLIKNSRQKKKLKEQQIRQEVVNAEIRSLKSQFNPHFVFNALSSIQGLITKKEMEAAHIYLNDFSMLLRTSLKESENEFVSLSKDLALVTNYLKLEQLRFNFGYEINVDPALNLDAVEVPVLLLQPVIENAIKHGIAGLYEKGKIAVSYESRNDDLVITVTDNGKGFGDGSADGHGLKLTGERVNLLNKIVKDSPVSWEIKRRQDLTVVTFHFKKWLA